MRGNTESIHKWRYANGETKEKELAKAPEEKEK